MHGAMSIGMYMCALLLGLGLHVAASGDPRGVWCLVNGAQKTGRNHHIPHMFYRTERSFFKTAPADMIEFCPAPPGVENVECRVWHGGATGVIAVDRAVHG